MSEEKEMDAPAKKPISPWAAVVWIVFVGQGLIATLVELIWGRKIALPGILDAWGVPMPWWSGLALAALGAVLLLWMHRRNVRVLD